jgi:acyl carrier protein
VPIDWDRFLDIRPNWTFLGDFLSRRGHVAQPRQQALSALGERLREARPEERRERLGDIVAAVAGRVLGHDERTQLDRDAGFFDLGFDSLTTVELRVLLQTALSIELPATVGFDYPTIHAMAGHLFERLFPQDASARAGDGNAAGAGGEVADEDVEAELRRELEVLRY